MRVVPSLLSRGEEDRIEKGLPYLRAKRSRLQPHALVLGPRNRDPAQTVVRMAGVKHDRLAGWECAGVKALDVEAPWSRVLSEPAHKLGALPGIRNDLERTELRRVAFQRPAA